MKNAVATLTIYLNIPEAKVRAIADGVGCDPANEGDRETILNAIQSEIEEGPSMFLEYATSEDVEVDG